MFHRGVIHCFHHGVCCISHLIHHLLTVLHVTLGTTHRHTARHNEYLSSTSKHKKSLLWHDPEKMKSKMSPLTHTKILIFTLFWHVLTDACFELLWSTVRDEGCPFYQKSKALDLVQCHFTVLNTGHTSASKYLLWQTFLKLLLCLW